PSRDPSAAPRTPGSLGHGHSLPGPWPRRPRPFPRPSHPGRQLQTAASLTRAPAPPARSRGISRLANPRVAVAPHHGPDRDHRLALAAVEDPVRGAGVEGDRGAGVGLGGLGADRRSTFAGGG